MMGLPAGTRIWLAAGITDMRFGMNGLAAKVQIHSLKILWLATCLYSGESVATWLKCCGPPAMAYAC